MKSISDIQKEYIGKLDQIDLELLLAHALAKPREFVLAHPELKITKKQKTNIKQMVARRSNGEPVAYILGHKEFFGLDFLVNRHTLIPRPETELLVEQAIQESKIKNHESGNLYILDIGTGSGNIIISITKTIENFQFPISNFQTIGIDISSEALKIAKKNAKLHGVDKKIKFLNGSLLQPIIENCKLKTENSKMIILANLPYLSKKIYENAPCDVLNFEPKSALYSPEEGLKHYRKLLEQLKKLHASCYMLHATCFLEISPEQKSSLAELIKNIFPEAKPKFHKDLAGKWRVCKIEIY